MLGVRCQWSPIDLDAPASLIEASGFSVARPGAGVRGGEI